MYFSFFKVVCLSLLILLSASQAHAQWSSDFGISTGSYEDQPYTEATYGLNLSLSEHRIWRNAVWGRFAGSSVLGLESSLRWLYDSNPQKGGLGIAAFAGPGIRLSDAKNTGFFVDGGLLLKAAGFAVGGGLKLLYYSSPGIDAKGNLKSKSDSMVFLILAVQSGSK
jgi:hypothetical protein